MEKVPQIVSERLKAASVAANHPDADLLTAFSESTLSAPERAVVLQHLAFCMECRDVVALALPAAEAVQEIPRPLKSPWFTWPVLRWGVVAAGVIIVGSFGFVEYQHRQEARANLAYTSAPSLGKDKEAKNVVPAQPAELPTRDQQQSPSAEPDQIATNQSNPAAPKSASSSAATPMLVRQQPPAASLQHGPHVQFQQNATFQNQAQGGMAVPSAPARIVGEKPSGNLPVPVQSDAVQVASAPPAANNETANLEATIARIEPPSPSKQLDTRVERSKPAMAARVSAPEPAKAIGGPVASNLSQLVAATPAAMITWNINSSGALQRSFDQGNTWQNVDVNRRSDSAPQTSFHGAAKEMASDALKKDTSSPVFRAVVSNGADVWAGASGGLLYHSVDAGGHWTRVVPSSLGTSLSGDILSLEFPDPQHGRIVTAAPEVWTTSDGGQSWLKQ